MTENKWATPIEIPVANRAFPGDVTGKYLPPIDEVPEEFKSRDNKWSHFVSDMFMRGWDGRHPTLLLREGIDGEMGLAQVHTCLRSFEPKHEHKIAGCAYLTSLFFEDVVHPSELGLED